MKEVVPRQGKPTKTVVLLHGHGGRPEELFDVAVVLAERANVRVLVPGGPVATYEGDGDGDGGRAWWNPAEGGENGAVDALLQQLAGAALTRKAVIVGFSQGGALASLAAGEFAAAAIVAGFLPDGADAPFVAGQRVLVVHGHDDDVVDPLHGRRLARLARRAGAEVTTLWHEAGHEWTPECTEAVLDFLGP